MGQDVGRKIAVYLDAYNISGDLNEVGLDISANHPEDTAFGDTHITRTGSGLGEWSMTHSGYFSDATTAGSPGIEEILRTTYAEGSSVEYIVGGAGSGNYGYAGQNPSGDFSVGAPLDGVITLNATYTGSARLYRVRDLTGQVTNGCTSSASGHSGLHFGGSMAQAAGFLRVLAGSATTGPSGVFTIEHSGNGTSWSNLITFTTATGSLHEVKGISSASAWIRATRNISDSGGDNAEFTYHVSFGPALIG